MPPGRVCRACAALASDALQQGGCRFVVSSLLTRQLRLGWHKLAPEGLGKNRRRERFDLRLRAREALINRV